MNSNSNIPNRNRSNRNISHSNKSNIKQHTIYAYEMLCPGDVSDLLHVSLQTLRRWYKEGKLKAKRTPGGQLRIPMTEVERLLGVYAPIVVEDESIEATVSFDADCDETDKLSEVDKIKLSELFRSPDDPVEAQIERDIIFGYTPRNVIRGSSLMP